MHKRVETSCANVQCVPEGRVMSIEIMHIKFPGNIEKERIVLAVRDDDNAGNYAVLCSPKVEGGAACQASMAFWLPYLAVKKGDMISVHTRSGADSTRPFDHKIMVHNFHLNRESSIWKNDCWAILLTIEGYKMRLAGDIRKDK